MVYNLSQQGFYSTIIHSKKTVLGSQHFYRSAPELTYRCKDSRRKKERLDVAPLVDALLGLEVDALLGRDGHGLLVLQQLVVDVLAVDHRVPAPVEDEADKVLPFCQDLKKVPSVRYGCCGGLVALAGCHEKVLM